MAKAEASPALFPRTPRQGLATKALQALPEKVSEKINRTQAGVHKNEEEGGIKCQTISQI